MSESPGNEVNVAEGVSGITLTADTACPSRDSTENVEFEEKGIQGLMLTRQLLDMELNVKWEPEHREADETDCPELNEDTRRQKEYDEFAYGLKRLREKYKKTRDSIDEEIRNLTLTKQLVLKDIRNYKKELMIKLEELEERSVETVNERYKEIAEEMRKTTGRISDLVKQIDEILRGSQSERMTKLDSMGQTIDELRDKDVQIKQEIEGFEGLSISFDKGVETVLGKCPTLVKINRPCNFSLFRTVDIAFESDTELSGVCGICSLLDGSMVMTDLSNDCLKRLDKSYTKKDFLKLEGGPLGICSTGQDELAVTLRESRIIQFVECTDTNMKSTRSFPVECSCNYICYLDNLLFVTCDGGDDDNGPGHVRKFDMTGNLLGIMENRVFKTPLHITTNIKQSSLFITDMDNKVIVLDKTGNKVGHYRNSRLESPFGISVLPNDNILVSSMESHCLQQFDDKYRYVGMILSHNNGLQNPVCIKFNAARGQIVVCMDECNSLLVYNVSYQYK